MPQALPLRILFIGNSFTNRNDLPALLAGLAAAAEPPGAVEAERVLAIGASLRQHWNAGTAARLIEERRWDWVVLQEQSTLPIKNPVRYHENVRLFIELIRESGARAALYLTWARRHAPETQAQLTDAALRIARETGAAVIPAGIAWQRVLESGAPVELHDADGSHPSLAGSYLAACAFYAVLFGRSPEALPFTSRLDPATAQLLQREAWAAAQDFVL
jgi:hypothetical protein